MNTNNARFHACEGYNPWEHLIASTDGWYLPAKSRTEWFNHFCYENGLSGMIDNSEGQIIGTYPTQSYLSVATIYINGTIVAKSAAIDPLIYTDGSANYNYVETAGTHAKGRALANLGFGTDDALSLYAALHPNTPALSPSDPMVANNTFASGEGDSEVIQGGSLCDAPVNYGGSQFCGQAATHSVSTPALQPQQITFQTAPYVESPVSAPPQTSGTSGFPVTAPATPPVATPAGPTPMPAAPVATVIPAPVPTAPAVTAPVVSNPVPVAEMDENTARAVIIPSGKNAGRTMGDVLLENPGYITWLLGEKGNSYCLRYPQVAAAARALSKTM